MAHWNIQQHMSRDETMNKKLIEDKLIKLSSSLKSLIDMLAHGDALLATDYKNWPKSLPVGFLQAITYAFLMILVAYHLSWNGRHDRFLRGLTGVFQQGPC